MSNVSSSRNSGIYLSVDSGSPTVSVAVGRPEALLASRAIGIRGSSEALLASIHEVLDEAGIVLGDLAGIVALAGPGSFTGLRVGLATVVGLHLSSGVRATTLPTLDILALQGVDRAEKGPLVAAVDAQRGEWAYTAYDTDSPPGAISPPVTTRSEAIASLEPEVLIGFGCSTLPEGLAKSRLEPTPLAPTVLRWLSLRQPHWDAKSLYQPIYSRPPAVSLPR